MESDTLTVTHASYCHEPMLLLLDQILSSLMELENAVFT
ncbi:uncharacterized protein G2W53_003923 [Senna tora]|uniref:Uncharacterized protein n=1 Tax=Senna tora TaxID=362788 RepID=A0A834XBL9_9FABA|nr:uncharacterized protein G2W53_003923 [Senna tora]